METQWRSIRSCQTDRAGPSQAVHYTVSKLPVQCERSDKCQAEVVYTDIRSETPVWEFYYLHVSIMYRLRGKNFKCLDKNFKPQTQRLQRGREDGSKCERNDGRGKDACCK